VARRKVCPFCVNKVKTIDYKDVPLLRRFISDRGRMEPRRKTGVCAKHQRVLSVALKRARYIALLPYTAEHVRESGILPPREQFVRDGPPRRFAPREPFGAGPRPQEATSAKPAAEEVSPEGAVAETTAPEAVAEEASAEEAVAEETAPEAVAEETSTEEAVAEVTEPEAVAEETSTEEAVAEATAPEAVAEETSTEEAVAEATSETAVDDSSQEEASSDESLPDEKAE